MKKLIGILPSVLSAYFVFFLYSHNCQDLILDKTLYPFLASILLSLIVSVVSYLFVKNIVKSDIISSLVIFVFFTYGYLTDFISSTGIVEVKHRFSVPLILIFLLYAANFIHCVKNIQILDAVRSKLTIIFLALLAFNLVQMFPKELDKHKRTGAVNASASSDKTTVAIEKSPDVYLLILDEYASSSTIKNFWGYDNSSMERFLIDKGFTVSQDSVVRFNFTKKAVSSYLNMEYINDNSDTTTCYNLINKNKVMTKFKILGYDIIALDNFFSVNPAKGQVHADYNFNFRLEAKSYDVDGLTNLIVNQSMLRPFSYMIYRQYGDIDDYARYYTEYTFAKLLDVVKMKGPKFVYSHIICPHTPFTFGQNGETVNVNNRFNWKDKRYYLDQYIYINKNLVKTVDHILNNSANPPIIVVMSDHGPRPQLGQDPAMRFTIPEQEMFKVFYSYYLPKGKGGYLTGKVDPVNTFTMIFDKYFSAPK